MGTLIFAISPTLFPKIPLPIGESTEILPCYGPYVNTFVVGVQTFFYITITVTLMRGVLLKYIVGSQNEEDQLSTIYRTNAYMRCLFNQIKHPPPWNLLVLIFVGIRKSFEGFFGISLEFLWLFLDF